MRTLLACLLIGAIVGTTASADSVAASGNASVTMAGFPDLGDRTTNDTTALFTSAMDVQPAIWPFGGEEARVQPKSTRKAFFLSLLLPGLGETYVGSKRGIFFLGVEAVAWWMYVTNTNKGNDLEKDYENFADQNWRYYEYDASNNPVDYSYWEWLKHQYSIPSSVGPEDYDEINAIVGTGQGGATHNLPSTRTQQYYEMIGKYDQFVYGWKDIAVQISENEYLNPSLVPIDPKNYTLVGTGSVTSILRENYVEMREDSNKKLKAGQRGIYIMLINRVLSAIDAGRLAYKHNQSLNSDISMIQFRVAQKKVLDNSVPMLMVYRSF